MRPPHGFYNYICRKFEMLTSLRVFKQQRDPKCFFSLNVLVQSNQEMIKFVIFGEFFENEKGTISHPFTSLYLFFYTLQWLIWKKLHINIMMICTSGKKIRFYGELLSIPISTFAFQHMYKVLSNWTSFINLVNDGISSKIVQFCWSFFHRKAIEVFFYYNGGDHQNYST